MKTGMIKEIDLSKLYMILVLSTTKVPKLLDSIDSWLNFHLKKQDTFNF